MVTTFVRSAGDRSKGVWKFLDMVRQTDTGVEQAGLEHSSLKRCLSYCSGRVPILVHPSLYRSRKVRFPLRRLGSFLDASRRTVLVGDWNAILDPNIDRAGRGASGLARCEFLTEFDLIDRYRLDHPGREMWTWIGSSPSGQVRSYLDRVLVTVT